MKNWKSLVEELLGIYNEDKTLAQKTGYSKKDLRIRDGSIYSKKGRRLAKGLKTNEQKREAIARIEGHAQHPEKYAEDYIEDYLDGLIDEETLARKTGYSAEDLVIRDGSIYSKKGRRLAKGLKTNQQKRRAIARIEGHAQHPEKYAEDYEEDFDDDELDEHIVKQGGLYYVYNKDRTKKLSKGYSSHAEAGKRLGVIEGFKAHGGKHW
jgi:hypothetical protein